jgi:7-cyano-7-deazaguanine synthase in queuosine biosynthesis
MYMIIERFSYESKQVLGEMTLYSKDNKVLFKCKTLELADKNNQKQVSCIPAAKYKVVKRTSAKYKEHFHITNVPNRDFILIHTANTYKQLLGCIAVGTDHKDIDNDGFRDVINSKVAMKKLLEMITVDSFDLTIKA